MGTRASTQILKRVTTQMITTTDQENECGKSSNTENCGTSYLEVQKVNRNSRQIEE